MPLHSIAKHDAPWDEQSINTGKLTRGFYIRCWLHRNVLALCRAKPILPIQLPKNSNAVHQEARRTIIKTNHKRLQRLQPTFCDRHLQKSHTQRNRTNGTGFVSWAECRVCTFRSPHADTQSFQFKHTHTNTCRYMYVRMCLCLHGKLSGKYAYRVHLLSLRAGAP